VGEMWGAASSLRVRCASAMHAAVACSAVRALHCGCVAAIRVCGVAGSLHACLSLLLCEELYWTELWAILLGAEAGIVGRSSDAMAVRVACRWLYLYSNQISGSIPSTLGSLTTLQ
jgi:hypothetical protein